MSKFSITQTAFAGYRLIRAKPGAALAWFLFQLAVTLGMAWLMVTMAGPQLTVLKEMQTAGGPPDPATAMALSGQIMPYTLLSMVLPIVTGAVLTAAILRAVLRQAQSGLGYLRFGADEFRLMLVTLVIGLFIMLAVAVAWIGGLIALFVTAGPQNAALALQGQGELSLTTKLAAGAAAIPGIALCLFLYVKLSLAAAQTMGERSIRIFGSWSLTGGIFWRTLATYVLAVIPVLIAAAACVAVAMALKPEALGGDWKSAMQPDVSSVAATFSGVQITLFILQALLMTLYSAALLTPTAVIYTALTEHLAPENVFGDDDEDED